jgi:hypothetical protein
VADAERQFAAQGVTKEKQVIAYCGGGISATIDLLLLRRLGYEKLMLYDGSMGDGRLVAHRDGLKQLISFRPLIDWINAHGAASRRFRPMADDHSTAVLVDRIHRLMPAPVTAAMILSPGALRAQRRPPKHLKHETSTKHQSAASTRLQGSWRMDQCGSQGLAAESELQ